MISKSSAAHEVHQKRSKSGRFQSIERRGGKKMIRLKNKHDMRNGVGCLFRSVMVGALLLNYIPIVSLTGIQQIQVADSTPARQRQIFKRTSPTPVVTFRVAARIPVACASTSRQPVQTVAC